MFTVSYPSVPRHGRSKAKPIATGALALGLLGGAAQGALPSSAQAYWQRGATYTCGTYQAAILEAYRDHSHELIQLQTYMAHYLLKFHRRFAMDNAAAAHAMKQVQAACITASSKLARASTLDDMLDLAVRQSEGTK